MTYETIRLERFDNVALITLNRPERLNAISRQMCRELLDAFAALRGEDVRALVITGASRAGGRPCFCAGADLKEIATLGPAERPRPGLVGAIEGMAALDTAEDEVQGMMDTLESLPFITIAAIDGVCTAGGLELALSCDIRVLGEQAQVSDLHIKNLGRIGGAGVTARLTRVVGPAWSKELLITGDPLPTDVALRIGFASHLHPSDRLVDEALALARRIAERRLEAIRVAKASIDATVDMTRKEALRFSYLCWAAMGGGEQSGFGTAGAKAFAERRRIEE
ncbi:MAG: enoyl-CoA hydratase/isomerase family protein [Chloroflexi bacterium]|nr:enoyl-CoA hydratase/isomerase family protein [Chloroflexota bacterium]